MVGEKVEKVLIQSISKMIHNSKFSKIMRVIYPKNCLNPKCFYWLITPNTLY